MFDERDDHGHHK